MRHRRSTVLTVLTILGVTGALVLAPITPVSAVGPSPWEALRTAFAAGGTVQLTTDVDNTDGENLAVSDNGSVTLDLNGHDLTIDEVGIQDAGIFVPATATLIITDTTPARDGTLDATGGIDPAHAVGGGAGIGGSGHAGKDVAGIITIDAGQVTAQGGMFAAGIGGGGDPSSPDGAPNGGTVTINGGTVDATGDVLTAGGAGIGGGANGSGGTVTIAGGDVTATGASRATGIGGSWKGGAGNVTIAGGTVTATSTDGAGIGTGARSRAVEPGTVSIGGGHVTATSIGGGAGIGGGDSADAAAVTISGGDVTATGGSGAAPVGGGAGIGGGYSARPGPVTIVGGRVVAQGGLGAAGIGGGTYRGRGAVTITGGEVTATGGAGGAAGIGGGTDGEGGDVTIGARARVTAVGTTTGNPDDETSAIGPGDGATATGELANAGDLTIPANTKLRIPDGATATNTGTIHNQGTIHGDGGTLVNHGAIVNTGTGTIADDGNGAAGDHGAFRVTGHNYTVAYDLNGWTGTTPPIQHLYAASFDAAGSSLPITVPGLGWYLLAPPLARATASTDLGAYAGPGPSSLTLTALRAQVLEFTSRPPAPAEVGGSYRLSATGGGSGQPVTFSSGGACAVAGTTAVFIRPGTCTVTAHQRGGSGHGPADPVVQRITVVAAPVPAGVAAPRITGKVTAKKPRRKHHGWYRSRRVTVTWTCTPGSAPLTEPCPAPQTYRRNGKHLAWQVIRGTDGTAAAAVVRLRIDHAEPRLQVKGVRKQHTYRHQPRIRCKATDRHSGIKKSGKKHRRCTVRRHRVKRHPRHWRYRVTARDKAGNKTTKRGTYLVVRRR